MALDGYAIRNERVKKFKKLILMFQFDGSVTNTKLTDCSVDIPGINSLN